MISLLSKPGFHGIVVNPARLHDIVGEDGGVRCRLQEMFQLHLLVLAPHLVVTINDGFLGDDGKARVVFVKSNLRIDGSYHLCLP